MAPAIVSVIGSETYNHKLSFCQGNIYQGDRMVEAMSFVIVIAKFPVLPLPALE